MTISQDTAKQQSTKIHLSVKSINELKSECLLEMAKNGISCEDGLISDAQIHRFSGCNRNDKAEWYVAFEGISSKGNPYLNCIYGSFREQSKYSFNSWEKDELFDPLERKNIQQDWETKKREVENKRKAEEEQRLIQARECWDKAALQPLNNDQEAYLERKKISGHGVKYGSDFNHNRVLIIPIKNIRGEIQGVQFIKSNGEKRIHGLKKGGFYIIGEIKNSSLIFIAEGYATAASIYEAHGWPVVVAFDCGNLDSVCDAIRKAYPRNHIIIAADNDSETIGNPGKTKAEEVAKKYQCRVIIPKFQNDFRLSNGKVPTDFNDVHVNFGMDELKKQLPLKPYLNPIDIHALFSLEVPPRKLLLEPWLPEQGLTMIYAPRGVGKTFVALSIAYAVASGGEIFMWKAQEPRRVLYIDGEMPLSTMQARLVQIANSSKKQPPDASYFKLITPDLQEAGIRDLSTLEGQADINEYVEQFDFIVLDNLSTLVRSGRENEGESWLPVQEWALELRRRGKTVLFVHHAGKAGQQRGTSRKEDVLDTVINLKRPKNYSPTDGAKFEVHFEKARGFDGDAAKTFEASLSTNPEGKLEWVYKEVADRDFEHAVELHAAGFTLAEIAFELGVNKSTVSRWFKKANLNVKVKAK